MRRRIYGTLVLAISMVLIGSAHVLGQTHGCDFYFNTSGPVMSCDESQFDFMKTNGQSSWDLVNLGVDNLISLSIDKDNLPYVANDFSFSVTLQLEGYNETDAVIIYQTVPTPLPKQNIGTITLQVSYDPTSGAIETEKHAYKLEGWYHMTATVLSQNFQTPGTVTYAQMAPYLVLKTRFTPDRVFTPSLSLGITQPSTTGSSSSEVAVDWTPLTPLTEAIGYDLEWVWIDENLPASTEIVFEGNSSRVKLAANQTSFSFPYIYEKGHLVFRVRMVTRCGANYDKECVGPWSYNDNTPVNLGNIASLGFEVYSHTTGHENGLNWMSSMNFAEGGKTKQVISYADGILRSRQSVAKINSTNESLVGETIYDHVGRAAINVLPVPSTSSSIGYVSDFNQNSDNKPYSWRDFELHDPLLQDMPVPEPMSDASGAAEYYSSNSRSNHEYAGYLPESNGYPFMATQFSPDPEGLVKVQGGLGAALGIGSGHEMTAEYENVGDRFMVSMFGVNATRQQYNTKIISKDQNGQHSFTVLDALGRTVATGLTGEAPANVQPLTGTQIIDGIDFMPENEVRVIDGEGWSTLEYQIRVWSNGNYQLDYEFKPERVTDDCALLVDFCWDCVYDFSIKVYDKTTGNLVVDDQQVFGPDDYDDPEYTVDCEVDPATETLSFPASLNEGYYIVQKSVRLSREAIDFFTDKYIADLEAHHRALKDQDPENETCFSPLEEFLDIEMASIDLSGCDFDCEACETELATLALSYGIESGEYKSLEKICQGVCMTGTCQGALHAMLADVTPGGQYAKYGKDVETSPGSEEYEFEYADFYEGTGWSEFKLSLLNRFNNHPRKTSRDGSTTYFRSFYQSPATPYVDENGNQAYVLIDKELKKPEELSVKEFVDHFQISWAYSLVPYHPEYIYYELCLEENQSGSQDFDALMLQTETYRAAYNQGLLNPLLQPALQADLENTANATYVDGDPFFKTGGLGNALRTEFIANLDALKEKFTEPGHYDLWEMSWVLVNCNGISEQVDFDNCFADYGSTAYPDPAVLNDPGHCDLSDLDQMWKYFRVFYVQEKQLMVQKWRNEIAFEKRQFNGCIGMKIEDYKSNQLFHDDLKLWASTLPHKPRKPFYGPNQTYRYKLDPQQTCYQGEDRLWNWEGKYKRFVTNTYVDQGISKSASRSLSVAMKELQDKVVIDFELACEEQCTFNAVSWLGELEDCAYESEEATVANPWEPGHPIYDALLVYFEEICEAGCDGENPFGATEVAEGLSTYSSVRDAVIAEFPEAMECWLSAERIVSVGEYFEIPYLDDCGCDIVEENHQNYLDLLACEPSTTLTERDLLFRDYSITVDDLQLLLCACDESEGLELEEKRIFVPEGLTCPSCASCDQLNDVVDRFKAIYGDVLNIANMNHPLQPQSLSEDQRMAFTNFANKELGMQFSAGEYDELISCCTECYLPPNGNAEKWLDIMNELVGNGVNSTRLIADEDGKEAVGSCSDVTRFSKLHAFFNYSMSPYPISIATSMQQAKNANLPSGLYGVIFDPTLPFEQVLAPFRLEFMTSKFNLGSVPVLFSGLTTDDIIEFTSVRAIPGMSTNQVILTAKIDPSKVPAGSHNVVNVLLTFYCDDDVSADNCLKIIDLHDCGQLLPEGITRENNDFDIDWALDDNADITITIVHSTGVSELAYMAGYLPGHISDPATLRAVQAYLDENHPGAFVTKSTCETGCEGCADGELSFCEDVKLDLLSAFQGLFDDLVSTNNALATIDPAGVDFDVVNGAGPTNAFELPNFMLPEGCEGETEAKYVFVEIDEEKNMLTGRIEFGSCAHCEFSLYADHEDFDFSDITGVLSITTSPNYPSSDPSRNFVMTVTTGTTYCEGVGNTSTNQVEIYGYSTCWEVLGCRQVPLICDNKHELESIDPCLDYQISMAKTNAEKAYDLYLLKLKEDFRERYIKKCLIDNESEKFTSDIDYSVSHLTLFYYDQAGNVVRTVPPKGVTPLCSAMACDPYENDIWHYQDGTGGFAHHPSHTHVTNYKYNSLGGMIFNQTPDGGDKHNYYDRQGRLVFSQNEVQKDGPVSANDEQFSYTTYDDLSRIDEVGQITVDLTVDLVDHSAMLDPINIVNILSNAAVSKEQVIKTFYDTKSTKAAVHAKIGHDQRNLIQRVAYTKFRANGVPDDIDYDHATYYSYDIMGNVDALVQENPELWSIGHDLKLMEYDFDLISGNVNQVSYQAGAPDQYYHRYDYDADNRLIGMETSYNGGLWTEDARYEYYDHGSTSRVELGGLRVQGTDYAYTLQGWLKAVNGNLDIRGEEIGEDGLNTGAVISGHSEVASDAFGYVLGYFDNGIQKDYVTANPNRQFIANSGSFTSQYDGNIGYVSINHQITMPSYGALHQTYQYDQLHRINGMAVIEGLNNNGGTMEWGTNNLNSYQTAYGYDANGNITDLLRNGVSSTAVAMDDFTYNYVAGTNQLEFVNDGVTTSTYIDDMEDQSLGNYKYDAIGNLVKDVSEGIDEVNWSVYGKVTEVLRSVGSTKPELAFAYDALNNRYSKTSKEGASPLDWTKTYYVRDAAGIVMATYQADIEESSPGDYTVHFVLEEQHIYSAKRLGTRKADLELYSEDFTGTLGTDLWDYTGTTTGQSTAAIDPNYCSLKRGKLRYELSDYLGNVRSIISDRKLPAQVSGNIEYAPDIVAAQDYYPFGMLMPGRQYINTSFANSDYRYGFQGQEADNEVQGKGNSMSAKFWQYDSRIGRRWNRDPILPAANSPYMVLENNPISNIDPDGLKPGPFKKIRWILNPNRDRFGMRRGNRIRKKFEFNWVGLGNMFRQKGDRRVAAAYRTTTVRSPITPLTIDRNTSHNTVRIDIRRYMRQFIPQGSSFKGFKSIRVSHAAFPLNVPVFSWVTARRNGARRNGRVPISHSGITGLILPYLSTAGLNWSWYTSGMLPFSSVLNSLHTLMPGAAGAIPYSLLSSGNPKKLLALVGAWAAGIFEQNFLDHSLLHRNSSHLDIHTLSPRNRDLQMRFQVDAYVKTRVPRSQSRLGSIWYRFMWGSNIDVNK